VNLIPGGRRQLRVAGLPYRFVVFPAVSVLCALLPLVPHSLTPNWTWWGVSWAFLAMMVLVGLLGIQLPRDHWVNTLAPLLLLPAIQALRASDGNATSGFTPMIFLPVVWFALYGKAREVWLAVALGALVLTVPIVAIGAPQYPSTTWRGSVLLIVVLAAIGPLINRLVESTKRSTAQLATSELRFRAAFEDAPVGMALTSLDASGPRQFYRVNHALSTMLGRTAQELTSRPVEDFVEPQDVHRLRTLFDMSPEDDTVHRFEVRLRHASGRPVWASISFSAIYGSDGRPSHLVSQIEDVSARRETDRALLEALDTERAATERMRATDRARSELISAVSHDVRTPLTAATGYAELLIEGDAGDLNDEQQHMLGIVSRNLSRIASIVDDLVRSPAMPGAAVEASTVDIGAVLNGAMQTIGLLAATRGQEISFASELHGVQVKGDPGRLERVLINLLTNAVKFTGDDGRIDVTAHMDGGDAVIEVHDTGIGIPPEDLDRIFERYYRSPQLDETQVSGSGLGLAIARAIATQHGGSITAESIQGVGSTFTLRLPARTAR